MSPVTRAPLTFSGGQVSGTLSTSTLLPLSLSTRQMVRPSISLLLFRSCLYVCRFGVKNSIRPWLAGFLPVINELQAGAVSGGQTDSNGPCTPDSYNFFKL